MKKEITIADLKLDTNNANKHTEYGMGLLEKSLSQLGAGRSILLDKDNNVICGNAVTETAGQIGISKVKIVETDGSEIIAVKRTDLSIADKKAKELSIADNSIANKNLDWDESVLKTVYEDIPLDDWGVFVFNESDFKRPDTTDESNDLPNKCKENSFYFYIEYYGNEDLFNQLKEILKDKMKSAHEIDSDYFSKLIRGEL